jgi:SAM-dependent methyltransferase
MKPATLSGASASSRVRLICPLTRQPLPADGLARDLLGRVPPETVEYPEVGGVRVVVPAASAVLAATVLDVQARRERFDQLPRQAPELIGASAERTRERYDAYLAAEGCNLELLEEQCAALIDYLGRERTLASGLTSTLALQLPGWTVASLLPYFYQDWGNTPSFDLMCTRLGAAVERHVSCRSTVAVLGCGAGGLVSSFARRFDTVVGVDLSLLGLLLARQLLDGGALRLGMHADNEDLPEFPIVTVRGAEQPAANTSLVAANVADLPFADGSMGCIVTQYLLDIVPDAGAVLDEINRVLSDGGIWLNYGCPFRLLTDPPALRGRVARDMPALLEVAGFELLEAQTHRHDHLNLSALTNAAVTRQHSVVAFAARKRRALPRRADASAFDAYFGGEHRPLFELRARLAAGTPLTCLLGSELRGETSQPMALFGVGRQRLASFGPATVCCPPLMASLVFGCLQRLAGHSPVGEVFDDLQRETAGLLSEADFVVALKLLRQLAWIELL